MLSVLFSEQECKGPDGDSKPTPFRKETEIVKYRYDLDIYGIFYSIILFSIIAAPSLYIIHRKNN